MISVSWMTFVLTSNQDTVLFVLMLKSSECLSVSSTSFFQELSLPLSPAVCLSLSLSLSFNISFLLNGIVRKMQCMIWNPSLSLQHFVLNFTWQNDSKPGLSLRLKLNIMCDVMEWCIVPLVQVTFNTGLLIMTSLEAVLRFRAVCMGPSAGSWQVQRGHPLFQTHLTVYRGSWWRLDSSMVGTQLWVSPWALIGWLQTLCHDCDFEGFVSVGRVSTAGLHKWMPFVIFRARGHERLQLPLQSRFLRRRWFMLCITVEVESRIAKQCKCQYCCVCKDDRGKVTENGKKRLCVVFQLTWRSRVHGKNVFLGIL